MKYNVSVIIATYNKSNLILRTIQSVINQTFQDFELIIVDDGSDDNTLEVIKKISVKDKRIKYIYQKNQGYASALNNGISLSNGKYIAILDDDDEWLPEKLEKQIQIFEKYPSVYLVSCWLFKISENNKRLFKTYSGLIENRKWCDFFKSNGILTSSSILFKKEIFDELGGFDSKLKLVCDLEFYIRVINNYDIYFLPIPLLNYYDYSNSLSKKDFWLKWPSEFNYILNKYEKVLNKCKYAQIYFLKTLGTCYLLQGKYKIAREFLLKCIKLNSFKLRFYLQYFLTFIPFIYKNLLFLKRKFF